MDRVVKKNEKNFFILPLMNLRIAGGLESSFDVIPLIQLVDDSAWFAQYLSPFFRESVGELEYEAILKSKTALFSDRGIEFSSSTTKPAERLERMLQICRTWLLASWLIKDNSINFETGFLHYTLDNGFAVTSNFLASVFTNAAGEVVETEFSKDELLELEKLYAVFLFHLFMLDKERDPNRLSLAWKSLDSARRTDDLGLKISFYCICFEALFSVDTTELSHKVAERIAFFIGDTPENRVQIYQGVKFAYGIRSKIVHGDRIPQKHREKTLKTALFCDDILRKVMNKIFLNDETKQVFLSNNDTLERYMIDLTFGVHHSS